MTAFRDMYWQSHDRLRLYARVYDSADALAPTVLCLPGLRRNCRDFEDLAPHLQKKFHVIAPDLRGRGLSARDRHVTNYQPNVYLHDILRLLTVINRPRVIVLGTSLGGILGMMLAVAQPARVSALILNDIGPQSGAAGRARFLALMAQPNTPPRDWSEAVQRQREVAGESWPGLSAERWMQLTRRMYREDSYGRIILECDPMVAEVTRQWPATASDLWPLWDQLRGLPVLALRAARSDVLTAEIFERMGEEHPRLQRVTVPDRGHFPLLDEPVALDAIDRFLTDSCINS